MIINEILKDIILLILTFGTFLIISKFNNSLYRSAFGKNTNINEKYYGNYLTKNLLHTIFVKNINNKYEFYIKVLILLFGIFLFPFTSDVWISGKFYKTNVLDLSNDFVSVAIIFSTVNLIELYSIYVTNKGIDDFIISRLFFNFVFIINTITLIFFFRSLDIVNIIQIQEGATNQLFGNLTIIKNPLLFFSSFFCFIIFLKNNKREKNPQIMIIEFLKNILISFYLVYFFLGGYSILFLPENFLDNLPFVYNITQLMSVFIKLFVVYVSLRYFRNKIKIYSSPTFKNFYFKLIFLLTIASFLFELTRESLHGFV